MDDGVDSLERRRQILWARKIADHGTGAIELHFNGTAQQDATTIPALRQFAKKVPADEAGCSRYRYERPRSQSASHNRLISQQQFFARAAPLATPIMPAVSPPASTCTRESPSE
jgi:hypothetical protein